MIGSHASSDTDTQIEIIIGLLLRVGVLIAGAVVLIGGIVFLWSHWHATVNYRTFIGAPADLRSSTLIVEGAFHLRGESIIQLGLLCLIATPVARVIFAAAAFFYERDYLYVVITLIVLATLLYSLIGHAG
jgi:uncharacterized membrane protein